MPLWAPLAANLFTNRSVFVTEEYTCDMCGGKCTEPDLLCDECAKHKSDMADERDLYGGPEL